MKLRNLAGIRGGVFRGAMVTSIVALAPMLTAVACSSSDENSGDFFEEDASVDAGASVTTPEADAATDANPAIDARPPFDPSPEAVVCTGEPCAVELVAGHTHFCARMNDGTVRCWGSDIYGQLGHGEPGETPTGGDAGTIPPVVELTKVTQLSAKGSTTCALVEGGAVKCWGSNAFAELALSADVAQNDYQPHPTPTSPAIGAELATRVDVGHYSVCVNTTTGKLLCWGNGQADKLARPVDDRGPREVLVAPGEAQLDAGMFATTAASSRSSLGLTKTGDVFTWGAMSGEDGLVSGRISSVSPELEPRPIPQLSKVTSLAVSPLLWREIPWGGPGRPPPTPGHAHACAIADGAVYCWGQSFTGALCTGLPDREREPRPSPVSAKAWPQQVTVGDETTCVRLTDGTVQCCGENVNGALARNLDETFSAYFVPATGFTSHAVEVVASDTSVCALVQGGTVECWGGNVHGELGTIPDRDPHSTPVKLTF